MMPRISRNRYICQYAWAKKTRLVTIPQVTMIRAIHLLDPTFSRIMLLGTSKKK